MEKEKKTTCGRCKFGQSGNIEEKEKMREQNKIISSIWFKPFSEMPSRMKEESQDLKN